MVASWELQPSVVVATLHVEVTTVAWALGLRALKLPPANQIIALSGMPYDMARNQAAMRCLESGADYLFFLDSDVIAPPDTVLKLMAHKLPVVSGVYCRRSPPHGVPVMMRGGQWVMEYPKDSIIEVDVAGAGCLLIHRSVFEQLPPQRTGAHWFDWRVNLKGSEGFADGECMSEDYTFNLHCRKHGIPVKVDTSIQCRHVGYAEARHAYFAPLECVA